MRSECTYMPCHHKSREDRTSKREQRHPLSPPKHAINIGPSELVAHLKGRDYVTRTWKRTMVTIPCRALRAEIVKLLKKGHLQEFLTEKGWETYGLDNEPNERRIVQQIKDMPSPPPIRNESPSNEGPLTSHVDHGRWSNRALDHVSQ